MYSYVCMERAHIFGPSPKIENSPSSSVTTVSRTWVGAAENSDAYTEARCDSAADWMAESADCCRSLLASSAYPSASGGRSRPRPSASASDWFSHFEIPKKF